METGSAERTIYQVKMDIEYEVRLRALHFRLFDRLRKASSLLTMLAGMAVLAPLRSGSPTFSLILGLVVALIGAGNFVWDFGGIARANEAQRRKYQELLGQLGTDVQKADEARAAIGKDDPSAIEALCGVAQNDVLRAYGHIGSIEPESRLERFFRKIA